MAAESGRLLLLSLPEEILEKVLSYLNYESLSNVRVVCKAFDSECCKLLNRGFSQVDRYHGQIQKGVKAQLPRRESERRNHPLARHVDILAAIETRLSLLNMTYMKYIDMGLCCFIPGKVLDEVFRVLTYIKNNPSPPRAHELLQELRDISSMAMEQFDEKIVPVLKSKLPSTQLTLNSSFPGISTSCIFSPGTSSMHVSTQRVPVVQRLELQQLRHNMRNANSAITAVKKELSDTKSRSTEHKRKISDNEKTIQDHSRTIHEQSHKIDTQDKIIVEMNRVIHDQSHKIASQDKIIGELNKKILGYDQKFEDILTEFVRVRSGAFPEGSALSGSPEKSLPNVSLSGDKAAVELKPEPQKTRGGGRKRKLDQSEVVPVMNQYTKKLRSRHALKP